MKGYMRIMPDWFGDLDEKLKTLIKDFAIDHDIDLTFVEDSKNINECIESICMSMVRLFERVKPMYEPTKKEGKK